MNTTNFSLFVIFIMFNLEACNKMHRLDLQLFLQVKYCGLIYL